MKFYLICYLIIMLLCCNEVLYHLLFDYHSIVYLSHHKKVFLSMHRVFMCSREGKRVLS